MADPDDGPPVIVLPERVDRRLRLGPFPSAHDAVKFLGYAGAGSLLAVVVTPLLGLAVIVLGFALSVVRYEDEALDRRAVAVVRHAVGSRPRTMGADVTPSSPLERRGVVVLPGGGFAAVVRAGGSPMAYLPPAEIARRFERFRELLRAEAEGLVLRVWLAPMRSPPVVPPRLEADRADRSARDGYAELVRLLCARRAIRQVDVLRRTARPGIDGITELEAQVTGLVDRLAGLDVPSRRLVGRSLVEAVHRLTVGAARADG